MVERIGLTRVGVVIFLLLTVLLTACEIPTRPTEICDWLNMPNFEFVSPASFSVIDDLRPTITWAIDPASTCVPSEYRIQVWSSMNYPPGASAGYFLLGGTATNEQFEWPSDAPDLLPGHSYYVYVNEVGLRDGELYEGGGIFGYFSTGPLCSDSDTLSAPSLRWPPDNWRLDPNASMDFEWGNDMTCWPDDHYTIEISKFHDFRDPIIENADLPLEHMWLYSFMNIGWENCTTYFWHVKANMAGSESEPWSETRSFITQPGDLFCPPDLGYPEIPPELFVPPSVRLLVEANCRSGPTMDYPVVRVLHQGEEYPLVGRSQDGLTWVIGLVDIDDDITWTPEEIRENGCWVNGELGEVLGDVSLVQLMDPDPPHSPLVPTPTSIPFNCAQYNADQKACSAQPACKWDPNGSPNSPCVNK